MYYLLLCSSLSQNTDAYSSGHLLSQTVSVRDLGAAELGGFGAEFHEVAVT